MGRELPAGHVERDAIGRDLSPGQPFDTRHCPHLQPVNPGLERPVIDDRGKGDQIGPGAGVEVGVIGRNSDLPRGVGCGPR